ncbi:MAG: hypothetical protein ABIQ12_07170 [Opitutaceae bacterium]
MPALLRIFRTTDMGSDSGGSEKIGDGNFLFYRNSGKIDFRVFRCRRGNLSSAMKSTYRIVLGIVSSLLLAAGFSQAAGKLDPTGSSPAWTSHAATESGAPAGEDCGLECDIAD